MCIYHRGPQIIVPEQLLNSPYVRTRLQQVGRERMAQRMTGDPLIDTRLTRRQANGLSYSS